jgi:hypothetical protein
MACSKYTLTNTGSSIVNFSYQRCDDAMWEYQVELNQGQTKTIWLLDSTYSTAFSTSIVEVDLGIFPPVALSPTPTISVTPSNTPTISVTPSNTPTLSLTPSVTASSTPTNTPTNTQTNTQTQTPTQTQTGTPNVTPTPSVTTTNTQTPTNTATQTPTPTNVVRTSQSIGCHDENTAQGACDCPQGATVFTNGVDFASSTLAWSDEFGVNTGDPVGFYVQDNIVYEVAAGCGSGCTTGSAITVVGPCGATPTPTNTQTPTETPTNTPTPSVTASQTPTVTATPTNTPTVTSTTTQTPTLTLSPTSTLSPTPTATPYRNLQFVNNSTTDLSFTGFTGTIPVLGPVGGYPITSGQTENAVHNSSISVGMIANVGLSGSGGYTLRININGSQIFITNSDPGNLPTIFSYTFTSAYSENDVLQFVLTDYTP